MSLTIYLGGGGPSSKLQAPARKAMAELCSKLGLEGRLPKTIVCGPRPEAISNFRRTLQDRQDAVLLVDAEEPIQPGHSAARHLGVDEAVRLRVHLMVQIMESWFLTQPTILAQYFGSGFKTIPVRPDIEKIPKHHITELLDAASRESAKGRYSDNKRIHGFAILARLHPEPIEQASPFARAFFAYLRENP